MEKIAETSKNRTYFAPLQTDSSTGHSILPMVKILLDRYDYRETGLCYAEIDFTPIMEILSSSCETQNTLLIYNADNKLTCTINLASFSEADISSSVLSKLEDFSNTLTSQDAIGQSTLKTSLGQFVINGCINNTTQWHIVQIISNEKSLILFMTLSSVTWEFSCSAHCLDLSWQFSCPEYLPVRFPIYVMKSIFWILPMEHRLI